MIIPDNVTVYMNGRAYYAHVCGFCQNGERLSLSIDTSGIMPTPPKPDFSSPRYCPDMACLNQILLDIDAYLIEKYGTTEKPNHDEYAAIEYFVNEYQKLYRKYNGNNGHALIMKHSRREVSINAQIDGKTVNVTYDPHDPEAVKAAEVWCKALFADGTQFKAVAPVAVKGGDSVTFANPPRKEVVRIATKMRMDELRKASEPLRAYLKAHGDPYTSVIVTQYGATETQDERHATFDGEKPGEDERIEKAVQYTLHHPGTLPTAAECEFIRKHPETVKSDEPAVPEIIANPGNYGVIGFWWEDWADGSCFLRWRTEPGADAMKVVCLTGNPDCGFQVTYPCDGVEDVAVPENSFPWKPRFFKADSKAAAMREVERGIDSRINVGDTRRLAWIRVKEPPKADLQQLDRAIRDLSDVVKDDQRGLHAYFDGVDMTYILECLKKYREMVGGAL